jgi:tRNA modification GTPase
MAKLQTQETIIAPATPPGSGGIAIIRVSGPAAGELIIKLHSRGKLALTKPRELLLGKVLVHDEAIDQGLAVWMPGPQSYTGEDVAELQLHASSAVVRLIIEEGIRLGARLAEPGEFTKRAYLNGKLDLAQAEAVSDIISAEGESAVRLAGAQLAGTLSEKITAIRAKVVKILAELSANLDFSEEDVPDIDRPDLDARLSEISSTLQGWLEQSHEGAIIRSGYHVAIIGLPNAGKSSLLNALVGYDRAIVTNIAGTTRDVLEEQVEINGLVVKLTDTAGLTETDDVVEGIGIERAWQVASTADLIMLTAAADQDLAKLQVKQLPQTPILAAQTKIDLLSEPIVWPVKPASMVRTSTQTSAGLDALRNAIYEHALGHQTGELPVLANLRHIQAVQAGYEALQTAQEALATDQPLDIVTGELTLVADSLTTILGENVNAEVIDSIFANFCIGK